MLNQKKTNKVFKVNNFYETNGRSNWFLVASPFKEAVGEGIIVYIV